MKKVFMLLTVSLSLGCFLSTAGAQIRIPETPEFDPKARQKEQKRFLFQIEPAMSFPSSTYEYESKHWGHSHEYEESYDLSVAGGNISFLPILANKVVSKDSSLMIEARLRFTSGFWHFEWDNLIPLEGGFDVGIPYVLSEQYKMIPYVGFQYGIGFHWTKGTKTSIDRMYTLRFGVDFGMSGHMRFGISYILNRVSLSEETDSYKKSGAFKYDQIALNVTI